MGRAIIMHIDDAPWIRGGPRGEGDHPDGGGQLVGDLEQGRRHCGPGTVVYLEANTQYGFEVWDEGVRFLNIRQGRATYAEAGREAVDPYSAPAAD